MPTILNDETLSSGTTLALAGGSVSLTGAASLSGLVQGTGTLTLSTLAAAVLGDGLVFDNAAAFVVEGIVTQGFHVGYGSNATDNVQLTVASGGTYIVLAEIGDTEGIVAVTGGGVDSGTIINLGVFEAAGATDASLVSTDFDNAGTILVARGTLQLNGLGNTIGGTVAGPGEFDLAGGSTTLGAGASLAVATLGVYGDGTQLSLESAETYAGDFNLGVSTTLDLGGQALLLTGTGVLQGTLGGGGTVTVSGEATTNAVVVADGATLAVSGTVAQTNVIYVSAVPNDTASLLIAAGATYDFLTDNNIMANGTGTVINDGTVEKTGADGVTAISAGFVNQGQVLAASGELIFDGTFANDGTVTAADASVVVTGALGEPGGGGLFDLASNGTVTLGGSVDAAQTIQFTGTSASLILNLPSAFAGSITGFVAGDTIDLAGIPANGLSYADGTLTLTETTNGTLQKTYALSAPGIADPGALALVVDDSGGTGIVLNHAGAQFTNPAAVIVEDDWIADVPGVWSGGANWTEVVNQTTLHTPPTAGNNAVFEPSGSVAFVVTYDESDTVNQLSGGSTTTLDQAGGVLTVNDGGNWYGGLLATGGVFDAVTGWNLVGDANLATGATAEVDSGIFVIGGGTLAGTLVGQGEFSTSTSGSIVIAAGFSISAATWNDSSNFDSTTLDTDVSYAGNFLLLNDFAAVFSLNGNTLTLSGQDTLNGGSIDGSGALALAGITAIGQLSLTNSVTATVSGTVIESSGYGLNIGGGASPDSSSLDITTTGTWDFVEDSPIIANGIAPIDNAGLIEKTGGVGVSLIQGPTFVDTGSIAIASGAIQLGAASNLLAGAIGGPGEIILGRGVNFALDYTIQAGATITAGTLEIAGGSTVALQTSLAYDGDFQLLLSDGSLALNGNTLTLTGVEQFDAGNFSTVLGTGEVMVAGAASVEALDIASDATLAVTGQVVQDGNFGLGSSATTDLSLLAIAAGGTWNLVVDSAISGSAASTIANAGLLEKTGGVGVSAISAGLLVNTGTVLAAAATTDLTGAVSGAGLLAIAAGDALELGGPVAGQTASFNGGGALILTDPTQFTASIAGFARGDTIDLIGVAFQSGTAATLTPANQLAFTENGVAYAFQLDGNNAATPFEVVQDAGTGTAIEVACFASGTCLATECGPVPVERLAVGDLVRTVGGALRPVRWIGHRSVNVAAHSRPEQVRPLRIRRDAFAAGVPERDVLLSPDHAVYLDGVLIPIKHLANGCSIATEEAAEIAYWHVELDRHDILLAEGLPVESYLDTANRSAFSNAGGIVALHPDFAPRTWQDACAELVQDGPRVVAAKRRLFERAGIAEPPPPLALEVLADQLPLPGHREAEGVWRFDVPPGARNLRLLSRRWMPAACVAASLDRRWLGVRVFAVEVDGGVYSLDDPALFSGFHPVEATAEGRCRWTVGDARLVLPRFARQVALRLGAGVSVGVAAIRQGKARDSVPNTLSMGSRLN